MVIAKVLDTTVKHVMLGRRKKKLRRAMKMTNETLTLVLQLQHLQRDHVVIANDLDTILKHVMLGKRKKKLRRQTKMLREQAMILLLQLRHLKRKLFTVVRAKEPGTHTVDAQIKQKQEAPPPHLRSNSLFW